jgi:DNA-binding response OmpR family regulator
MVVDDNEDQLKLMERFLSSSGYAVIAADSGRTVLDALSEVKPDLILLDVMMPEMDGYELCQKIKSDQRTSHIPVILLTAKADLDSRIEGLEYGADDYINKPFEADELKVRSRNLIEQRKRLRDKFSQAIEIKPGEVTATSMDEQFLDRLLMVFEKHVSDSGFSTERFAGEVGLSRSQLNRKLRALTDLSAHGFLLNLRLKRAAQLLKKKTGTVSEIAYAVGFESASNFARAFRSHYGTSPSDFLNRLEE